MVQQLHYVLSSRSVALDLQQSSVMMLVQPVNHIDPYIQCLRPLQFLISIAGAPGLSTEWRPAAAGTAWLAVLKKCHGNAQVKQAKQSSAEPGQDNICLGNR